MSTVVLVGSFIGMLCLFASFFVNGAPQQAALAGMACAFAVVPYVAFRVSQLQAAALQKKLFYEHVKNRLEELLDTKANS